MMKYNSLLIILLLVFISSSMVAAGAHLTIDHDPPEEFYANDGDGQVFGSTIENTGSETARDVHIELSIPSGFSFLQETLVVQVEDDGSKLEVNAKDIVIDIQDDGDDKKVTITFTNINPHEPIPESENGGGDGGENEPADRFVFTGATEVIRVGQTAYFTLQVQDGDEDPTTNHGGFTDIISVVNESNVSKGSLTPAEVGLEDNEFKTSFTWTHNEPGIYTVKAEADDITSANHTITVIPVTFDLEPGQTLHLEYKLATDADLDAEGKELETRAYHEDPEDPEQGKIEYSREIALFPYFKEGKLSVDLLPIDPPQASQYRGETIKLEASVKNTGDGTLFDTDFTVEWGPGFIDPVIVEGKTSLDVDEDNINTEDRTIATNIPTLEAGEEKKVTFTLLVEGREHFSLRVEANNDVPDLDVVQTLPFSFRPRRPNISINAPTSTVEISYNETAEVEITITNSDDNNYGQARNFRLGVDFSDRFAINNVHEDWTWDENEDLFTYTANHGHIPQGGEVTLTFDIFKKTPSQEYAQPTRIFWLTPIYENDEDDEFRTPLTTFSFRQVHSPQLSLDFSFYTPDSTDGDDQRLFLGEKIDFSYTPSLTQFDKWDEDDFIFTTTIDDKFLLIDDPYSIDPENKGDVTINGQEVTWTLTRNEVNDKPTLTIHAQVTDKPEHAGHFVNEHASVTGRRVCGVDLKATSTTVTFLVQSRDEEAKFQWETKEIKNLPTEGSFDVTGSTDKNIVEYELYYKFQEDSAGTWTGSSIADDLDGGQVYVEDSAQYKIRFGLGRYPCGFFS